MTSQQREINKETRMRLPTRLKAGTPTGAVDGKGSQDPYEVFMENLNQNIKMEGAARASKAYTASGDEKPKEAPSAVRPLEELNQAAKVFGIDFAALMIRKDEEIKALRESTDAREREVHELRLKELTTLEDRVKSTAAETALRRGGSGDIGGTLGIGELDPEVKRKIQERALGLNEPEDGASRKGLSSFLGLDGLDPDVKRRVEERVFGLNQPSGDGREPKEPGMFTPAWFGQWGELKPQIEAFVRMIGFVPREERESDGHPAPLVSMADVRSGQIPISLAIGLAKVDGDIELEKIRIGREHDVEMKRVELLADINRTVRENAPDAFAAFREAVGQHTQEADSGGVGRHEVGEGVVLKGIICSECGYRFGVGQDLESYNCPSCGAVLPTSANEEAAPREEPAEEAMSLDI